MLASHALRHSVQLQQRLRLAQRRLKGEVEECGVRREA